MAGENVDDQLWPLSVRLEVEPYDVFLTNEEVQAMAESYDLSPADLNALAARMMDWENEAGFVKDGRVGRKSRANPKGKLDYYEIGGRWAGFLQLRQPRPVRRWFGLFPAGHTSRVSSAKKAEIDQPALMANPPAAFVFRDHWFQSEYFAEGQAEDQWKVKFARHFAEVPEDTLLTIVDVHS